MEDRAKELIEIIASPYLLPLAIKYASKLGRIHLSEKLNELLPQLEEMVWITRNIFLSFILNKMFTGKRKGKGIK